jgi:hypothetical protein
MVRRLCVSTPQNTLTLTINLVALALIIASITVLGSRTAGLVAATGCLLLGVSGFVSQRLARSRTTATTH